MKLKMSKPFNPKMIKQLLAEEDKFITDIFSKMSLPTNELGKYNLFKPNLENRKGVLFICLLS